MLRSAARRLTAGYDEMLAPLGINTAQYSLLRTISRNEPVTLTEIGRRLELDRSTVGRNVRVVERLGLVKLGRGEDQREANVTLTEAGHTVLAEAVPLWQTEQAAFETRLGTDTAQALRETLSRI
ncbi:MarR family winged helix-turn-helix transcriptional regulator [Bosea sp. PAMC 26642]|uniref:MarR family winged helix-turn-helix transcriptional regulator n=1 Tax=Bosea sp. (strain PAMC 26642) TaxID=1792307 RepID=UPI001F01EA15|nr:MarR family transcriptional regulator [Bosea sp. PAMC 26642]